MNKKNLKKNSNPVFSPVYRAGWICGKINRFTESVKVGGKTTIKAFKKNPAIKATLDSFHMKMKTGKAEIHKEFDKVNKNADAILRLLKSKNVLPKKLAIDGIPGSGKSTLSRALAKKMDFQWKTLDYIDMDKPLDFSEERTIYEHHRLLRTQDIDYFDVIIYIDEPIEISKKRCLHRKRGAVNIDFFDYQKLKHIGERAFELADGEVYSIPDSSIQIKMRPSSGFRAYENICEEVKRKGLKTKSRAKESLLFLSVYGKPLKGIKSYINFGAYNKELQKGVSAGLKRFFAS